MQEYGLLDKNGEPVTDRTIDLDGERYTLKEVEALLDDPDTNLSRVAEVDGVPITLGDLATVIAIEREIQYLQKHYFSGRTFEDEALDNVNSLLNQLQTQGLTLSATPRAAAEQVVLGRPARLSLTDTTLDTFPPQICLLRKEIPFQLNLSWLSRILLKK